MLATEGCSQELVIRPNLDKATTFQKAAARITLISVISRQVNTNSSVLRNDSVPITLPEIREPQVPEISTMSSANILPGRRDGHLASVTEGSNESIEDKSGVSKGYNGVNGDAVERAGDMNNGDLSARNSVKDSKFSKKVVNGQQEKSNPFDYMKERKLSEPVMSPRKRTSVVAPKLTRCRSTVDLRDNEKPMVLKELGGYKFYAKASEPIETTSNGKTHSRVNENTKTNDISALNKTITEQKENITNREKHILHLEKKLALLEHENSKNKKQILSFREKLKDCSGTVDYLRREKELLASERDRLSFTLLTSEHELKELRSQNINLVTEYESAEHSRRIAVCHLQEVERVCHESHQEKPDHTAKRKVENSGRTSEKNSEKNSEKLIAQLNSMKEAVRKLRLDREALQSELNKMNSFFAKNLKNLVDQVQDIKSERRKVPSGDSRNKVAPSDQAPLNVDAFLEPENSTADSEDVSELDGFKKKLKSNEHCIDELANQIRDLEKRKKDLLEKRFEMIQEFQAGRDVLGELEADTSGNDTEDKVESEVEGGDRKRSRVTRKIRKLERTLSMDHGVGKLDCIQKLCKNLEDCEQRIHELEATNSELRAEHEDMEEEAKYLKYVLSYRGDVMKAQLQSEYETKMAALKDELEKCKRSETSRSEVVALTKRNRSLEEEVQRLHEELNTLLQNLPALQAAQRSSSRSSEHENSTVDVSANFADISSNLENSKNGKDVSWNTDSFSKNFNQGSPSAAAESGLSENSAVNSHDNSRNDDDNSQNFSGETVRGLEEKVAQLSEEKRVLLLSMQTLTSQWASRESCAENDISFTQNVTVLERNLRDVEHENACLSETLQRIRDVLEEDCERENNNDQEDKILKLKVEIQRFDGKVEASKRRRLTSNENQTSAGCTRHEERISELEMEIYRLHEEKKSLLSSIVRLQTDPNFTLSDDANVSDVVNNSDITDSNVTNDDVIGGDVIDVVQSPSTKDAAVSAEYSSDGASVGNDGFKRTHSPLVKKMSRDEEIQVNMSREGIKGLLGYLQRDLDKLRTALDEEGIAGNEPEKEDVIVHDLNTCPRQNSVKEVEQLGKELSDLGHHTHVLEEKLHESEAIRCDLHRTISIATDMATEERQKCEELTRTKAALEKEMLKLAKENRHLREGLETLSRARKRRNPRASRASPSSDTHEDDECRETYLPRAKARNFSESEFSDMDSPVTESKSFSRTA